MKSKRMDHNVAYHVHKLEDLLVMGGSGNNQVYDPNSGQTMRQVKDATGYFPGKQITPEDLNMIITPNSQSIDDMYCTHNGINQPFNLVLVDLMNTIFKMDQKIEDMKNEINILKVSKRKEAYLKTPIVTKSSRADSASVQLRRPIKEKQHVTT